jgi:hypothetical protein
MRQLREAVSVISNAAQPVNFHDEPELDQQKLV